MGYKASIVFDLKVKNEIAKKQLRAIVTNNMDKFMKGVRQNKDLEIRFEEEDY